MSFSTAIPATRHKSRFKTQRMITDALLAAIYFALTYFVIKPAGESLKITFASLAIVVTALLYGPVDACIVALIGEFLYQVILYGVTLTTPLWLVPPVLHALALGLAAMLFRKHGKPLYERTVPCYIVCVGCALLNSCFNSVAIYFDSKIFGYYRPGIVLTMMAVRLLLAVATALLVALVAMPLVQSLRKQHVV